MFKRFRPNPYPNFRPILNWTIPLSLMGGILFMVYLLLSQRYNLTASSQVNASTVHPAAIPDSTNHNFADDSTVHNPSRNSSRELGLDQLAELEPELGPRHQLTYQQWVALLGREADAIATKKPKHLYVLAGDSLSLWFPAQLLPQGPTWLNQGISGETSYGLLHRVKLLDQTEPKVIFVMIGINDLIHGVRRETLVANQREILRHLKRAHPKAKIVVQSILPHGGDRTIQQYAAQEDSLRARGKTLEPEVLEKDAVESTTAVPTIAPNDLSGQNQPPAWVSHLSAIPNTTIRKLNQRLATMAREEKVEYLDLHSFFTDEAGNIERELTTDGLHLSLQGYELWRSQLQRYEVIPK